MPRYGLITTNQFVDTLTYWLNIRVPDILEEKTREQIKNPPLFPSDALRFKADKNVEAVLEGPCSSPVGSPTVEFPLGKCIVEEGAPDKSWVHAVIDTYTKKHGRRPASILLFANCCSDYTESHKRLIQKVFPDIIWHFPYVPDLCGNHHPGRLATALLQAGYLEIVPATETASA